VALKPSKGWRVFHIVFQHPFVGLIDLLDGQLCWFAHVYKFIALSITVYAIGAALA